MGAIYKIINRVSGNIFYWGATEDIDALQRKFEIGEMPARGMDKYKHKENLLLEVVEYTDRIAERYAYYKWPQLSRVEYSPALMANSLDETITQRVERSISYLVCLFPCNHYSFKMILTESGKVGAYVLKQGELFEYYEFSNAGKPTARGFYES